VPLDIDAIPHDKLVAIITNEVLYRIQKSGETGHDAKGTAVLITSFVPGCQRASDRIKEEFGDDVEYFGFGGYLMRESVERTVIDAEDIGYDAVTDMVSAKAHVVLLAPKLETIKMIAEGHDSGIAEYLTIRSMLWGKDVNILLDFEPPKFWRNTLYESLYGQIKSIEDIGISVMTYECMPDEDGGLLQLVTERDVRACFSRGMVHIRKAAGALVTPAARDAARELNVSID
jgi:hypothetical protein